LVLCILANARGLTAVNAVGRIIGALDATRSGANA
jgi:hypothetical protein